MFRGARRVLGLFHGWRQVVTCTQFGAAEEIHCDVSNFLV